MSHTWKGVSIGIDPNADDVHSVECPGCPWGTFHRHVYGRVFLSGERMHRAKMHRDLLHGEVQKMRPALPVVREERPLRGRVPLGKTHSRSSAGKARQNARRKANRGRSTTTYRYKGTELMFNVIELGSPPKGRYAYHKARYTKAGRPWEHRTPPFGFRLMSDRKKFTLPTTVVDGLIRIYSNPVIVDRFPKRGGRVTASRAPRRRTRSDSLNRSIKAFMDCIQDDVANIIERPGLLARTTAEVTFRMRDDPSYIPPGEVYDALVSANQYIREKEFRKRYAAEGGYFRSKEIYDEMEGIISLSNAREELKHRIRRSRRVLRAPDGTTIEWF